MRFKLHNSGDDWSFDLVSDAGETILNGETYTSRDAVVTAIRETIAGMRKNGNYRQDGNAFSLLNDNGNVVATSSDFDSAAAAQTAATSLEQDAVKTTDFPVDFTTTTTTTTTTRRKLNTKLPTPPSLSEMSDLYVLSRNSTSGVAGPEEIDADGKYFWHFNDASGKAVLFGRGWENSSKRKANVRSTLRYATKEKYYDLQEENGKYYFVIRTPNGFEISRSAMFNNAADRKTAIDYITANADAYKGDYAKASRKQKLNRQEYNFEFKSTSGKSGFETFKNEENKKHYFHLNDADGNALLYSQGYKSGKPRDTGMRSVIKNGNTRLRYRIKEREGKFYVVLLAANNQEIARSRPLANEAEGERIITYIFGVMPGYATEYGVELVKATTTTTETDTFNIAMDMPVAAPAPAKKKTDNYMPCNAYDSEAGPVGFHKFKSEKNGHYFFSYNNEKGETVWRSEGYTTSGARDNGIESVKKNAQIEGRITTHRTKSGKFFAKVKAGNNQEIARSCYMVEEKGLALLLAPFYQDHGMDANVVLGSMFAGWAGWRSDWGWWRRKEEQEQEQIAMAAQAESDEKARIEAEAAARAKAEEEARLAAAAAAKAKADEEARLAAEAAAKVKAEEEARLAAAAAAKAKADEEARLAAEAKARAEAEEQARLTAEAEERKKAAAIAAAATAAAAVAAAAAAKQKADNEAAAKVKADEEASFAAAAVAQSQADEAARLAAKAKADEDARLAAAAKADEAARLAAKAKADEAARLAAQAKAKADAEAKRLAQIKKEEADNKAKALAAAAAAAAVAAAAAAKLKKDEAARVAAAAEAERKAKLAARKKAMDSDNYLPCEQYKTGKGYREFKQNSQYFFAFNDEKGNVIMRSEGYNQVAARNKGRDWVKRQMKDKKNFVEKHTAAGKHYFVLMANDKTEIARSCYYNDKAAMLAAMGTLFAVPVAAAAAVPVAAAATAAAAAAPVTTVASSSIGWWKWLLPLLLLLLLLLLFWKGCLGCGGCGQAAVIPPVVIEDTSAADAAAAEADSLAQLKAAADAEAQAALRTAAEKARAGNPLFANPNCPGPKELTQLGTNPEFGSLRGLDAQGVYNKFKKAYGSSNRDKRFLDNMMRGMGYPEGFAALTPAMITSTTVPRGTKGNMGSGADHKTTCCTLNVSGKDLAAFRIKAAYGNDMYFMKTCGNHFYF